MDELLEMVLPHATPFALVLTRLSGLFVFAPMLTSLSIPMSVKALLAATMAMAVYPGVVVSMPMSASPGLMDLVPLMAMEIAVGAVLGLMAAAPVLAVQGAGHLMGYQMGLGIAQVYNPELDVQSDALAELVYFLGFAVFLSLDGLEALFAALSSSFGAIPPGSFGLGHGSGVSAGEAYMELVSSGFELMLRVSAPVTAVIVLILLAMGVLMKTMPQLNVLTVGFAIKIMAGMLVLASALTLVDDASREAIAAGLEAGWSWLTEAGEARGG